MPRGALPEQPLNPRCGRADLGEKHAEGAGKVRAPDHVEHRFRGKWITDSGASGTPIPAMPNTDSGQAERTRQVGGWATQWSVDDAGRAADHPPSHQGGRGGGREAVHAEAERGVEAAPGAGAVGAGDSAELRLSPGTVSGYLGRAQVAKLTLAAAAGAGRRRGADAAAVPRTRATRWRADRSRTGRSVHLELRRKHVTKQLLWQEYREAQPGGLPVQPVLRALRAVGAHAERHDAADAPRRARSCFWTSAATGWTSSTRRAASAGRRSCSWRCWGPATTPTRSPSSARTCRRGWAATCRALEFFGGVAELWVPDNLKSGGDAARTATSRTSTPPTRSWRGTTAPRSSRPGARQAAGQGEGRARRAAGGAVDSGGAAQPDLLLAGRAARGGEAAAGEAERRGRCRS